MWTVMYWKRDEYQWLPFGVNRDDQTITCWPTRTAAERECQSWKPDPSPSGKRAYVVRVDPAWNLTPILLETQIERTVRQDAESASLEELEAAAAIYDRLEEESR